MAEQEYTVTEAAAWKNIPVRKIRYWLKKGLPSRQRGGVLWIKAEDLEKFLAERVEVTTDYRLKKVDGTLSTDEEENEEAP